MKLFYILNLNGLSIDTIFEKSISDHFLVVVYSLY